MRDTSKKTKEKEEKNGALNLEGKHTIRMK